MVNETDTFFKGVLVLMGLPETEWRLNAFAYWASREGVPLYINNPLATTWLSPDTALNLDYDSGYGPGNWNWVPVRVYDTVADGQRATFNTLQLGYYPWIRKCLQDQTGYDEAVQPNDFKKWVGSIAYGQAVVDHWRAATWDKGEVQDGVNTYAQELNAAVVKRLDLIGLASRTDEEGYHQMVEAHSLLREAGLL